MVLSVMERVGVVDVFDWFSVESVEKQLKEKMKKIFKNISSMIVRFQ